MNEKKYPVPTPADAPRFVQMAAALVKTQELEPAEGAAELAVASDQTSYDAWLILGIIRAQRKNYSQAIPCYLRALELKTDDVNSWCDLGELYMMMGDYPKSAAALRQAMQLDPTAEHPAGRRARAIVGRALVTLGKT